MPDQPLLSILVPTKNRSECARHVIESLLAFQSDDYEVVVHDNSDDDSLSTWVGSRSPDARLRYTHTSEALSMSQNFERAIECAEGRFVGALGDDDGLSPCVLDLCRWLEDNHVDALAPATPALYQWPGVQRDDSAPRAPGRLTLGPYTGQMRLIEPEPGLRRLARTGARRLEQLPTLYHGVVRRACLQKVREQTGRWLPGVSPDMAAAVALASHVNRVCQIDYPVFVPGASPKSGAGRGLQKTHHGDLKNETYLDPQYVESWPAGIPEFFSGPTMWAAGALQAMEATGRRDLVERFNYSEVHAGCLVFVPWLRDQTLHSLRRAEWADGPAKKVASYARCGAGVIGAYGRRLRSFVRRQNKTVRPYEGVATIGNAMELVRELCSPLNLVGGRLAGAPN